jgi:hypothetical protein
MPTTGFEGGKGLGLLVKRRRCHHLLNKRWNLFLDFMSNESGTGREEGGGMVWYGICVVRHVEA